MGRDEAVMANDVMWDLVRDRERFLTTPGLETETIQTIDGPVRYIDWCIAEAERIGKAPGRTARVVRKGGKCYVLGNYYMPRYQK